jgi:PAS domain S-box-containing protein
MVRERRPLLACNPPPIPTYPRCSTAQRRWTHAWPALENGSSPAAATPGLTGVGKRVSSMSQARGRRLQAHDNGPSKVSGSGSVWYAPQVTPEPASAAIRPIGQDPKIRPLFDAPSIDSPSYRQFLEALGVAVYTTDAEGHITFFNEAAADFWGRRPEIGEEWCGSWKLFWPDGRPMAHDECPMAIALKEGRSVRGYEGVAERPDGTRAAFVPYPTVVFDASGALIGAINVLVDVTERRRAEEALRAANAVKDEFLGLVSHELRTPVTTIFGNARMLQGTASLPDRDRSMVADIATDAERLLGLVENLLLMTRAASEQRVDLEPQVLGHVLRRIVEIFRRQHPQRDVRLDSLPDEVIVDGDQGYLELLVGNLLANADKYSPETEPIEIVLRRVGGEARVTVCDRGIGITEEDVERLFTAFYRTPAARRMAGGRGIGLSASKHVVAILGGRIWANPREDGGSEFGFALPLSEERLD